MYWLVYQQLVEKETFDQLSGSYNILASIYIRRVKANSEAEAIGKFIIDIKDVPHVRRIEPITCFEFDRLKTI